MWFDELKLLVLVNQLYLSSETRENIISKTNIKEDKIKYYIEIETKFKKKDQGKLGYLFLN